MFDIAVTALVAVFFTGFWSRWRYGFFDLFCFAAALIGAFATPILIEKFFPLLIELGGVESEAAGALIGCLIYDMFNFGLR